MSSDWIKWDGGECPVGNSVLVDLKYKIGEYSKIPRIAGDMVWERYGGNYEIVAYRLHKSEQPAAPLTEQLSAAIAKRDKQATKVERHAEKLEQRKAEVERLIGELERDIEEATGLVCTIHHKKTWGIPGSSIPVSVQVGDIVHEGDCMWGGAKFRFARRPSEE